MTNQTLTTPETKRRGQAVAGAMAGVVMILVLFAVYFAVRAGSTSDDTAAAKLPAAAPSQAAPSEAAPSEAAPSEAAPSAAAAPPVKIPAALSKQPTITAGTGTVPAIKITPIVRGTGPVVRKGQTLTANYVVATYQDGKVIDSSWKRGQPFETPIGVGQVIKGWDDSIPGQRVGSRLQIDVPAAEAYGSQQGDLRFIVDLLAAH